MLRIIFNFYHKNQRDFHVSRNVYSCFTNELFHSRILEQESCEVLSRDILEHLNLRSTHDVSSKEYDILSARIRSRLKQYTTQVGELSKKLKLASFSNSMYPFY